METMETTTLIIAGHCVTREGLDVTPSKSSTFLSFRTLKGWEELWDDEEGSLLLCEEEIYLQKIPYHFVISVEKVWTETWQANLSVICPSTANPDLLTACLTLVDKDLDEISSKDKLVTLTKALTFFGACATIANFRSAIPKWAVMAAIREAGVASRCLEQCLSQKANSIGDNGFAFVQGLLSSS